MLVLTVLGYLGKIVLAVAVFAVAQARWAPPTKRSPFAPLVAAFVRLLLSPVWSLVYWLVALLSGPVLIEITMPMFVLMAAGFLVVRYCLWVLVLEGLRRHLKVPPGGSSSYVFAGGALALSIPLDLVMLGGLTGLDLPNMRFC